MLAMLKKNRHIDVIVLQSFRPRDRPIKDEEELSKSVFETPIIIQLSYLWQQFIQFIVSLLSNCVSFIYIVSRLHSLKWFRRICGFRIIYLTEWINLLPIPTLSNFQFKEDHWIDDCIIRRWSEGDCIINLNINSEVIRRSF